MARVREPKPKKASVVKRRGKALPKLIASNLQEEMEEHSTTSSVEVNVSETPVVTEQPTEMEVHMESQVDPVNLGDSFILTQAIQDPFPPFDDMVEDAEPPHSSHVLSIESMRMDVNKVLSAFISDHTMVNKESSEQVNDALEKFRIFNHQFVNTPFFDGLDEYLQLWKLKSFMDFFSLKKGESLNDGKKVIKPTEAGMVHSIELVFREQEFAVCVGCFRGGRPPQRCIFFKKNGFTNHRSVCVGNPLATDYDRCKRPAESAGAPMERHVKGGNIQVHPRACRKTGIDHTNDYKLFQLPDLPVSLKYKFVSVAKGSTFKWARTAIPDDFYNEMEELSPYPNLIEFIDELIEKEEVPPGDEEVEE